MEIGTASRHAHVGRRRFLGLGAAAAVGGAATAVGIPATAGADDDSDDDSDSGGGGGRCSRIPCGAMPKPIPQVIDASPPPPDPPPPDPFKDIHWLLPGPDGSATPILGLPGFGLDVDPSLITDFSGAVAYAVLAGEARDRDGNDYDVEFDVRVMQGEYVGEDGRTHHGTFGFF